MGLSRRIDRLERLCGDQERELRICAPDLWGHRCVDPEAQHCAFTFRIMAVGPEAGDRGDEEHGA